MIVLGRGAVFSEERESSGDIMLTDLDFMQHFYITFMLY